VVRTGQASEVIAATYRSSGIQLAASTPIRVGKLWRREDNQAFATFLGGWNSCEADYLVCTNESRVGTVFTTNSVAICHSELVLVRVDRTRRDGADMDSVITAKVGEGSGEGTGIFTHAEI
jgi:hypothetical protein